MEKRTVQELFKTQGLKNTPYRHMIYEVLAQTKIPVTAEQLFLHLKEQNATIHFSTVYRTLEAFVKNGMVQKTSHGEIPRALFQLAGLSHQHHMVCVDCHRVFVLEGCPLAHYERKMRKISGFHVTAHKLEMFGHCRECQSIK